MRGVLLILLLGAVLPAADLLVAEGYPPLPNPYDFDRRLVLVDWFRDRGEKLPANVTEDDLVLRYKAAIDAARPKAKPDPAAEAERERLNHRRNMLLQLERQFKVAMAADATDEEIADRLDREVKALRARDPQGGGSDPQTPAKPKRS